ncbi:MAG TPA: CHAP domain-containing protein [Chloroflexia bacterium]
MKVKLDNVRLNVSAPVLEGMSFIAAEPGAANQIATASKASPFVEVSIIAMPYGTRPPAEAVPHAERGKARNIHRHLHAMREASESVDVVYRKTGRGPRANIFGATIQGHVTLQRITLDGETYLPVLVVEWVTESGPRTWLVRVSQEMPSDTSTIDAASPYLSAVEGFTLDADNSDASPSLSPPGPVKAEKPAKAPTALGPGALAADAAMPATPDILPPPPWWSDPVCDRQHYRPPRVPEVARPLGGGAGTSFNGVLACGPKPGSRSEYDLRAFMKRGDFGILEWECVEISIRFMYMAYGIPQLPFGTNGSDVVRRYANSTEGQKLVLVKNGTTGQAPRPGDILSYGQPGTVGHTSVCIESKVDPATGNGKILVIEQNNSDSGIASITVKNWHLQGFLTIFHYLHKPLPPNIQDNGVELVSTATNPSHSIHSGFKILWEKPHLGLWVCGYPLTDEMAENGLTVQYFENVRMEWQPNTQPKFGPVAAEYVQKANIPAGTEPTGSDVETFPTGHSAGGAFLELYKRLGKAVCGHPVTGEIPEPENGITVQYFQNVRMERQPNKPARIGAVVPLLRKLP